LDKIYLFAIPYAGGSAAVIYGKWARYLQKHFIVMPLEMAGHGRRMSEQFHENMDEVVADLFNMVRPIAKNHPYVIYGHSMGCIITYELVKKLQIAGYPPPQTIFLSGRNPPDHAYASNSLHLLADNIFLQEIRKIGGTPDEFFEMKSLVDAFLPIIRSDYRIIEHYVFSPPIHVMDTDLVFLHSDQDVLVSEPTIHEWQRYCSGRFEVEKFQGGHFFINDYTETICELIGRSLSIPLSKTVL
jgi:surfactin synthase thioesterase subunit